MVVHDMMSGCDHRRKKLARFEGRNRPWLEHGMCVVSGRQARVATDDAIVRCHKRVDVDAKVLEASQGSGVQVEQVSS